MGDFWEDTPDYGGTLLDKKKKKQLQSLYYAWFHDENEADLGAGPGSSEVQEEDLNDFSGGHEATSKGATSTKAAASSASSSSVRPQKNGSNASKTRALNPDLEKWVREPTHRRPGLPHPPPGLPRHRGLNLGRYGPRGAGAAAAAAAASAGAAAPAPAASSASLTRSRLTGGGAQPPSASHTRSSPRAPSPIRFEREVLPFPRVPTPAASAALSAGASREAGMPSSPAPVPSSSRRTATTSRQQSQVAPQNRADWILSPPPFQEAPSSSPAPTPALTKVGRGLAHGLSQALDTALYPLHSLQSAGLRHLAAHPYKTPSPALPAPAASSGKKSAVEKSHNHPSWLLSPPSPSHFKEPPENHGIATVVGRAVSQALDTALFPIHSLQSALLDRALTAEDVESRNQDLMRAKSARKAKEKTPGRTPSTAASQSNNSAAGGGGGSDADIEDAAVAAAPKQLSPIAQHWLRIKEQYPSFLLKANHRPDNRNSEEMKQVEQNNPPYRKKR